MSHAWQHLPVEDLRVRRTFDAQDTGQSALGPRQRMINQNEVARHLRLEFGNDGSARRHADRLNSLKRRGFDSAPLINLVEDFSDDVE